MNPDEGNICGADAYETKPYLFYFDATKCFEPSLPGEECPGTTKLCVSDCPTEFSSIYTSITNPNEFKTEILWYADQLGADITSEPVLFAAIEAEKIAKGGVIPEPTKFLCIKQSYASVKEAAALLAGGDATQAGLDLQGLIDRDDCNMYTIPSKVSDSSTA